MRIAGRIRGLLWKVTPLGLSSLGPPTLTISPCLEFGRFRLVGFAAAFGSYGSVGIYLLEICRCMVIL